MRRLTGAAALSLALLLAGCSATPQAPGPHPATAQAPATMSPVGPDAVTILADGTDGPFLARLGRIYIGAQPTLGDLRAARERGVTMVINLREQGEDGQPDAGQVRALGLHYLRIPVAREGETLDRSALTRIGGIVAQYPDRQILLHCSSGNRASAWLAVHLVEDHGMGLAESLEVARRTGLTSEALEARIRRYLDAP